MISFYSLGKLIQKKSPNLNVLGSSALIMLVIEPHLLFQISFQFSFMALLGIVFLFPLMRQKIDHWNLPIPTKLRDGMLIAAAAQLSLFPMILFYFKEFPIYALLGALPTIIAIPLIMGSGLLMVAMGFLFSELAVWVGNIHQWLLERLMGWMEVIQEIRGNTMLVDNFDIWHLLMLFTVIALGYLIWVRKSPFKIFAFFALNLVFIGSLSSVQIPNREGSILTIYATNAGLAVDIFQKDYCYFVDEQLRSSDYFNRQRASWRKKHACYIRLPLDSHECSEELYPDSTGIRIGDNIISLVSWLDSLTKLDSMDYLIFNSEPAHRHIIRKAKQVIIPASVSRKTTRTILNHCRDLNIPAHVIREEGAFIQTIYPN